MDNVLAYFDALPREYRLALLALRDCILEEYPGIEENMELHKPTYIYNGNPIFALDCREGTMVLYVLDYPLLEPYREALHDFELGRAGICFTHLSAARLAVLRKIIQATGDGHS